MSGFADSPKKQIPKKNWAEDSSDDEEEDEASVEENVKGEELEEEDESSDEENDEDSKLNLAVITEKTEEVKNEKKAAQMSKKERKEQKAKELDDLDSLLAEMGVEIPAAPDAAARIKEDTSTTDNTEAPEEAGTLAKKDTKKKKKGSKKDSNGAASIETPAPAAEAPEEPSAVASAVDMKAILAARTKGKATSKTGSSSVLSAAQKIALEEAKNAKKKSTKRDKTKFSEGSY
jgi:hypothetical protein